MVKRRKVRKKKKATIPRGMMLVKKPQRNQGYIVSTSNDIIPERLLVTFNYQTGGSKTPGTVGFQHNFRNSCFDFDDTNPGHQPPLWDALVTNDGPYTRCRPYAVKLKVSVYRNNTGTPANLNVYLGHNTSSGDLSNPNTFDLTNNGDFKLKALSCDADRATVISKYFDLRKLIGQRVMKLDEWRHGPGLNPQNAHFFMFGAYAVNGVDSLWSIDYNVEAKIYCELDRSLDEHLEED